MNKSTCLVCFSISNHTVSILDTYLQAVFEELTDLKLQNESHLCFICLRILQEYYHLQQLNQNDNFHDSFDKTDNEHQNKYKAGNPSMTLFISKMMKIRIPCNIEMFMEVNVKQEANIENEGAYMPQDNLNYCKEKEMQIKDESFYSLSSHSKSRNYYFYYSQDLQIEDDNITLKHPKIEKVEMKDTNNIFHKYDNIGSVPKYTSNINWIEANSEHTLNNQHLTPSKVNIDAIYSCKYCPYVTKVKSDVLSHELSHEYNKSYSCDVCKKTFLNSSQLTKHSRTHTNGKPYGCKVCNKTFSRRDNLIRHKRTHTGEKPFGCDLCDKTFSNSSNLMTHRVTHTGEKLFECNVCNKTFSQRTHLILHNRKHTGDKPYVCDICHKTFSNSSNLITHKRTHTGEKLYGCDVCNKTFSQRAHLKMHVRTHTGDKPYACDACNKTFSVNSTLIKHKKTHTNKKPYKCVICKKTFTQNSSLEKHKKIHTDD